MRPILKRSKSVGSIVEGSTREETPIRQLSSLSLNDVEELDTQGNHPLFSILRIIHFFILNKLNFQKNIWLFYIFYNFITCL